MREKRVQKKRRARRTRKRGRSAGQCEMVKIIIITSDDNNNLLVALHAANAIKGPSRRKERGRVRERAADDRSCVCSSNDDNDQ